MYASVGVISLKKNFSYKITKRFALYFWLTFKDYDPEDLPAIRFHLDPKWIIKAPILVDDEVKYFQYFNNLKFKRLQYFLCNSLFNIY